MKQFWALDYVDKYECELVYNDQLYNSWEEANAARLLIGRPELFDITKYGELDLEKEVYNHPIIISNDLKVHMI